MWKRERTFKSCGTGASQSISRRLKSTNAFGWNFRLHKFLAPTAIYLVQVLHHFGAYHSTLYFGYDIFYISLPRFDVLPRPIDHVSTPAGDEVIDSVSKIWRNLKDNCHPNFEAISLSLRAAVMNWVFSPLLCLPCQREQLLFLPRFPRRITWDRFHPPWSSLFTPDLEMSSSNDPIFGIVPEWLAGTEDSEAWVATEFWISSGDDTKLPKYYLILKFG